MVDNRQDDFMDNANMSDDEREELSQRMDEADRDPEREDMSGTSGFEDEDDFDHTI